ncbi:hypothetical protein [Clostridium butyricum]|uniref:hypothetical protein n=1 Tax=Clostridium butyricum TaxID=1492 RepID=UPI003465F435
MDHIEIVQRLQELKRQLMSEPGTIDRNVHAVTKAIWIVKNSKNTNKALVLGYVYGIASSAIVAMSITAIFR